MEELEKLGLDGFEDLFNIAFVNDKEPVYTLFECLNSLEDDILDFIFNYYKDIHKAVKGNIKSKKTKIELLNQKIPEMFTEFLNFINSNDEEVINDCIKNKTTNKSNSSLLSNGFLFGFLNDEENIYIVPKELLEIYKKNYTLEYKKDKDITKVKECFFVYGIMNGVIEKDFFINLLKEKYQIKLTIKEIENIIKENKGNIYKNKYYTILDISDKENMDSLIDIKNDSSVPYKILDEEEMVYYLYLLQKWFKDLDKIFKNKKDIDYDKLDVLFKIVSAYSDDSFDILDDCNAEFDFDSKISSKLFEFIEENLNEFRFWDLNGNTLKEFDMHESLLYLIKKLPKKHDLKSLLNSLSREALERIYETYDIEEDINELIKAIKDDFQDTVDFSVSNETLETLRSYHESNFTVDTETYLIANANLFIYEDNHDIKVIIPSEFLEILDDTLPEEKEIHYVDDIDDYVYEYITANGIIEREKLQELLFKHHEIKVNLDELDKIVKKEKFLIKDNLYIVLNDFSKEEIDVIKQLKDTFGLDYKVCDYNVALPENNMMEELEDFLDSIDIKNSQDIISIIISGIKFGIITEEGLKEQFKSSDIKISSKDFKEMYSIIKKYKNNISIWIYNGYSINEFSERIKKVKIGRNEKCPCGSNKKYKYCCGK